MDCCYGIIVMKELTRIFSRQKNLLYYSMWDDSDRKQIGLFGSEIKNNLFQIPSEGKGSVWYVKDELESLKSLTLTSLSSSANNSVWDKLKLLMTSSWNFISPYVTSKKEISSVGEFKDYYSHLVDFWVCLSSIVYEVLDEPDLDNDIRKSFSEFREETEKYTEDMSKVMSDFVTKNISDRDILFFSTEKEIVAILENNLSQQELDKIKERTDGCFMLNGTVYPLDELSSVLKENGLFLEKTDIDVDELKGSIAFKGVITGTVKVILEFDDLDKISEGDILVTEQTNPKYVSAMKLASAVVTDEGGTLCHAAITSRELKKPCIIGTKTATKALKDGDEVEVNADKGMIKIIKRK